MINMQRKQQGFTLIELMIVIAIVAILVALALPAYIDFTIRTKVGECIDGGAPIKLNVAEHFDSLGEFPQSPEAAGIGSTTNQSQFCLLPTYVVATGAFTVIARNGEVDPSGSRVSGVISATYTPTTNSSGGLDWACSNSGDASNAKFLPAPCRGT